MQYTEPEIKMLMDTSKTYSELSDIMGRSVSSIAQKCHAMGINRSNKIHVYQEWELALLKNPDIPIHQLAKMMPHRAASSIRAKCNSLGVNRSYKALELHDFTEDRIQELLVGEFGQVMTGHLLGDGSIGLDGSSNRFGQGSVFSLTGAVKEYIEFTQQFLNIQTGRSSSVQRRKGGTRVFKGKIGQCKDSYQAYCAVISICRRLREKWYPNGRKIVPSDIGLSPIACNRWYTDDGSLNTSPNGYTRKCEINLCTDGFDEPDVDLLIDKMESTIGIHPTKQKAGIRKCDGKPRFHIAIGSQEVVQFLNYIGPPCVKEYAYKWDLKGFELVKFECKICGKEMQEYSYRKSTRHRMDPRRRACSSACKEEWMRRQQQTYRRNKKGIEKYETPCIICGTQIEYYSSTENPSNKPKVCGDECKQEWLAQRQRNYHRLKNNLQEFKTYCVVCNAGMSYWASQEDAPFRDKTCSKSCSKQYRESWAERQRTARVQSKVV